MPVEMRGPVALSCCFILAGCGAHDTSGIFISRSSTSVQMVQLVETPDHRVTGRYESDEILTDGSIKSDAVTIEGTSSGHDLLLTIKPISFINAGISATGTVDGDKLSIHGRGIDVNLNRTSLVELKDAIAAIRKQGGVIAQEVSKQNAARAEASRRALAAQQAQLAAEAESEARQRTENAARAVVAEREFSAAQAKQKEETKRAAVLALTAELTARLATTDKDFASLPDFGARFVANTQLMRTLRRTDKNRAEELVRDTDQQNMARQSFGQKFGENVIYADQSVRLLSNSCIDRSGPQAIPCASADVVLVRYAQRKKQYIDTFQTLKDAYRSERAAQVNIFNMKRSGHDDVIEDH